MTDNKKNNTRSEPIQATLRRYETSVEDLESVARAIRDGDGDSAWKALELLELLAAEDEASANEILAIFPPLTEIKSAYTRRWGFDLLESLILENPQAGLQYSQQLIELLSDNNEDIPERTLDLLLVLAGEDMSQLVLTEANFDSLLESDTEIRTNVYKLLKLAGTDSELPLLKEQLEFEAGEPASACRTAIQAIKQREEDSPESAD